MNSPVAPQFRLDENELHASALRAQVAERCRRTLSHDMNNVVQSMHSGLELLSKCLNAPGLARISPQECIALLQQQFVGLQQKLDRVIGEMAAAPGGPETIDLSALVTDAVHTLRHERALSKARLNIDAGVLVHARPVNVRSATLALVLDSIDAIGENGSLELSVHNRGGEGTIDIHSAHVALDRAAARERTVVEIARDVLVAEGGELALEQEAGTRHLRIRLPAAAKPNARAGNEVSSQADAGMRVLIADRNRDAADSLAMILQLEGYAAQAVYSGSQLSQMIDSLSPHLVLVDTDLPECDVREIARKARAGRKGTLPMLVQVSSSDRNRLGEFDAHVLRPVEWPQLQTLIKKAQAS